MVWFVLFACCANYTTSTSHHNNLTILLHFQIDSFVAIYLTRHICETAFLEHQHIVRCDFCCVVAVFVGYGNYLVGTGGVDFYIFNGSGLHVAYVELRHSLTGNFARIGYVDVYLDRVSLLINFQMVVGERGVRQTVSERP